MSNKTSILQNNEHSRVGGSCNISGQFSRVLFFPFTRLLEKNTHKANGKLENKPILFQECFV